MKGAVYALLLIVVALRLPLSFSSDELLAPDWYSENMLLQYRDDLMSLKGPVGFESDLKGVGSASCVSAYRKLYKHQVLDIRIFFGYSNDEADPGKPASDLVSDSYFKSKFIELLTRPCEPNLFACGFTSTSQMQPGRLTKEILGPDLKPRQVVISLESSSVSESDTLNRHGLKSDQKKQSRQVANAFAQALGEADVVLYAGHARTGTGPGFKPITPISLAGLATWLFMPARETMLRSLKRTTTPPALIGIFSCRSDHYYRGLLHRASPRSGLIVTTDSLNALEEAHGSLLGTLNSILGLECEEDFRNSLRKSVLYGFFPPVD